MVRLIRAAILLLLLVAASADAQTPVIWSQAGNTKNQQVVSGVASPAVFTLTVPAHTRGHVYSVAAFCSAGTSQVTVADGGTTIWQSSTGWVGTTIISAAWMPGLTGGLGATMTVTLASCGGGNTGTLTAQADTF